VRAVIREDRSWGHRTFKPHEQADAKFVSSAKTCPLTGGARGQGAGEPTELR